MSSGFCRSVAEHQDAAVRDGGADPAEQLHRLVVGVVADRAADEEHHQGLGPLRGCRERFGVRRDERLGEDLGLLDREPREAFFERGRRDVGRHEVRVALHGPRGAEQHLGLHRSAGAQLEDAHRPAGEPHGLADDLGRVGLENRALGAGRVVLGQLGDALEQRRSSGVVEQVGGQRLRGRGEPSADGVGDSRRRHEGLPSSARRTPATWNCVFAGQKLRYVARTCAPGVRYEPPRRTIWFDMNFPLYSPTAPAAGWKPG